MAVRREPRRDVGRVAALPHHRLGDGAVELTSARRAHHLERDRSKLVVAEVILTPEITDDPTAPELVDVIDDLVLGAAAHRGQQTHREGPTDDGRDLGQPPLAVGQLAESCEQDRAHRRCEHRLAPARGDPGPKRFDHEQWVALGLAPQPGRELGIDRMGGAQTGSERRGGRLVEPRKR
jgi:hypothetical protein